MMANDVNQDACTQETEQTGHTNEHGIGRHYVTHIQGYGGKLKLQWHPEPSRDKWRRRVVIDQYYLTLATGPTSGPKTRAGLD